LKITVFSPPALVIVDAHGYGKRFVVRADEKLTAFLELVAATRSTGAAAGWVVISALHAP
jgi:hypothetical protein